MDKKEICIGSCRLRLLDEIVKKILDPETIVVFTTAPASRSALGEQFGKTNFNAQGKIVGFLKMIGVDFVFDTSFGADLTSIAEGDELAHRLNKNNNLPLLNSCCPAFKKFVENFHKELTPNLSTARTPVAMTSLFIKSTFATQNGIDPSKIYVVALTPCLAKKIEIKSDFIFVKDLQKLKKNETFTYKKQLSDEQKNILNLLKEKQAHCNFDCNISPCKTREQCVFKLQLTDAVLTTNELSEIIKLSEINFDEIPEQNCDMLSGNSLKFGASGGVAESVVQCCLKSNNFPMQPLNFSAFCEGVLTCKIPFGRKFLNIAKVVGLKNFTNFCNHKDFHNFHFVEVMNCVGGCIGGTGQPTQDEQILESRKRILQKNKDKFFAYENNNALEFFKEYKAILYAEKSS